MPLIAREQQFQRDTCAGTYLPVEEVQLDKRILVRLYLSPLSLDRRKYK